MIVETASGLEVELDKRLRVPGRREDRFDLYLPKLGMLIELDPAWSHHGAESLVRDTRKTKAALAAGLKLVRIREHGLPPIPVSNFYHYEAASGVNPADWAEAIGYVLRSRGQSWANLSSDQVGEAITKGVLLWQEVAAKPQLSALDVAPHLADEFIGNISNPGKGLDWMTPGCNDVCAWRCRVPGCGYEWDVSLAARTLAGRGCRRCGWRKTGAYNSQPRPGESLAEVNPAMADELLEVIGYPDWTAWDLLPNSRKRCRWRCSDPTCRYEWPATPG